VIKLGIITFQDGFNRGACDFYPLIRLGKELREKNIKIQFFKSHKDKKLLQSDIIGVDSRYYRDLTVHQKKYSDLSFIIDAIKQFRSKEIKVVIFDNDDSSGGRQWDLIQYVDILVKKQVLKNREYYTLDNGLYNYKPFVKSYGLKIPEERHTDYKPCAPDQLHKIKLGWNIGMKDYRYFPFTKYFPVGTSRLFNTLYKMPQFAEPSSKRTYDSSFRGEVKKDDEIYSYQRNRVIELFKNKNDPNMKSGIIIAKKDYLKEMRNSKITVSPYGWGEVCYRDFEAILNGSLLVKPSMEHLETYPDVYKKNSTYIPLRWDMKDLDKTLSEILENYEDYIPIIKNAQREYKKALNDSIRFVNHILSILEIE
jgi:ribosomal silencing factor RsfS